MKLIFVYNSDGTVASTIKDAAHKFISPKTYPCNLCRITYPLVSMEEKWRTFIESLPYQVEFVYRDEFQKYHPEQKNIQLPAVFTADASVLKLVISHNEINKAKNLTELIAIVNHFLTRSS